MASLRRLAQLAGVSRTTIMRALRPESPVAEDTRQRILALVAEHGYSPPAYMTAHRRQARPVIGCLVPRIDGQGAPLLAETVGEWCLQHQYDWLLRETFSRPVRTQESLCYFLEYPVNGIVIHSGHALPLPADMMLALQAHHIPVVLVDMTPCPLPLDRVGPDEHAVGEMAVGHLVGLGHQRIAILGNIGASIDLGRPQGIRRALACHGLSTEAVADTTFADYLDVIARLLHQPNRPTAIIAESDLKAMQAIAAAHQMGISVPHQLSVIGVGDYPYAAVTQPPLTTIALNTHEVAQRAVKLLHERMTTPFTPTADTVKQIAIKPHLIERASSASPPRL